MKKLRKVLAITLTICMIFGFCIVPTVAGAVTNELKFNEDGKFKIVIFSDTQDHYVVHPRLTLIMSQALRRESPDLVVFLGDQTEMNTKDPEVDFRRSIEQILQPVVDANVPYAFVFGNHDDQSYYSGQNADKDALFAVYRTIGDCRTTDPNPSMTGTGTCNIPIYSSDGNDIAFNLWMIDSNPYQNMESRNGGYGCPQADQLQWLTDTNDALTRQEGHVVPSIAFQHVPMPQIYELLVAGSGSNSRYGKIAQLNDNATGYIGELPCPCPPDKDQGEFATLKAMGVQTLFTGHDHLNDFTGTYDGLTMTAVPGMTYLNYGDEAVRGYGVIELDEDDLDTYEYHSVKFSELDKESHVNETYDVYDEITYTDLKKNGVALTGVTDIGGGNTFTYDVTSPSHSAVLKVRWIAGTETGIQFSFDKNGNNMTYPFGVWVQKPDSTYLNGAWHLKPDSGNATCVEFKKPVQQGDAFDIEFGRLKVVTGAPEYVGQYYVYLKVNGKLITSSYTAVDENGGYTSNNADCQISNQILFTDWSRYGNKICAIPDDVTYPEEDIFNVDFSLGSNEQGGLSSIAGNGSTVRYVTDATLNRRVAVFDGNSALGYVFPKACQDDMQDGYTYEILYKLPSVPAGDTDLASSMAGGGFGTEYSTKNSRFEYWQSYENDAKDYRLLYLGSGSKVTNQWVHVVAVWNPDARDGDGQLRGFVNGSYVDYSNPDSTTLKFNSNSFYIGGNTNGSGGFRDGTASEIAFVRIQDKVCSDEEVAALYNTAITPKEGGEESGDEDSPYYHYDVIEYADLKDANGNALGQETSLSGGTVFTYNRTSETGSAILKYRWTVGSIPKFQLSFDKTAATTMDYMFGTQLEEPKTDFPNGHMWLRPGYGPQVNLPSALAVGSTHDVEFARLKVKEGENAEKYHVYIKIDGRLIAEEYVSVNVNEANQYVSNPKNTTVTISNEILITCWGSNGNMISAIPEPETFEDYDEIGYFDLLDNGSSLSTETEPKDKTFTYKQTSASGSAIFKYRWKPNTGVQSILSFDVPDDTKKYNYMFCVQIKAPDDSHPNGVFVLRPGYGGDVDLPYALESGKSYDVEFARLKVKSGPNKGKYYVYFKLDGTLLADEYVNANIAADGSYTTNWNNIPVQLSNKIYITNWGSSGNMISAIPEVENYDIYDELTLSDLGIDAGYFTNEIAGTQRTYTSTSPSHSAVLKFKWEAHIIAGDGDSELCIPFDDTWNHSKVGVWFRGDSLYFCNALPIKQQLPAIISGTHDVEFGRKLVTGGSNTGKYYVYLMVDGNLLASGYTDYYDTNTIQDKIWIRGKSIADQRFADWDATPEEDPDALYYAYDEIDYSDLKMGGASLGETTNISGGANIFTYDRTSPTGSAILRYRWTVGNPAKFQISFDRTSDTAMDYMFGAQLTAPANSDYPNGDMWLRPGMGPQVGLDAALAPGSSHNIEFARLKVKNGPNAGKYYVYIKIDDKLIAEDYTAVNVVNANDYYVSNPGSTSVSLSNEIIMTFWGSSSNKLSAYIDPSLIVRQKGDFDDNGLVDAVDLAMLKQILLGLLDTDGIPYEIIDFNSDEEIDVRDLVAMKKYFDSNTIIEMVSLQIGSDPSQRSVVWSTNSLTAGRVQLAKKSDMTGDEFPNVYQEFAAVSNASKEPGAYTNQVIITDLLPNTEYVYRVGNGIRQWSDIYSFKTQSFEGGSFSFLLVGDPQLGWEDQVDANTVAWADTLTKGNAVLPDASFLLSLGDQVDAAYKRDQFTAFFGPEILKSMTLATVVGNHDYNANYGDYFRMPNVSELGVSEGVGSASGDYWYIYDNVLFMGLNSNNTNVEEHRQFMIETMAAHPDVRWNIVTMHHSLYCTANSAETCIPLREVMAPVFSELDIDVVLSAHDHAYVRTYMMDGLTPVVPEGGVPNSVTDPEDGQVLYVSFNSSSGSLYCSHVSGDFPFVAVRNQERVPNVSTVMVTDTSFKVTTYRTNDMSIVDEFTIYKS